jgi:flagellar secretion chaperone FliS
VVNRCRAYSAASEIVDEDDKPRLLLKVLQTMMDKLEVVKVAIHQRDYAKKYAELSKLTITLEALSSSLDMSQGDIAKNLSDIYGYLIRRLGEVHTSLNVRTIDECKNILSNVFDGFSKAYDMEKKNNGFRSETAGDVRRAYV